MPDEKHIHLTRKGFSDREAAEYLFQHELTKKFIWGVWVGVILMAFFDLTDLHICVGDCDFAGYDIIGPRK